jgi:DNA-directed RNA polymerase subunit RPC12/RpoP
MGQYNYAYKCRDCGTELGLKMRATNPTKKPKPVCPQCGSLATDEDDSDEPRRRKSKAGGQTLSRAVVIGIAAMALIFGGLSIALVATMGR